MLQEKDIIYESSPYWVLNKKSKGFEIYKTGLTHSVRCAIIGYQGEEGLNRAKAEIKRRKSKDAGVK